MKARSSKERRFSQRFYHFRDSFFVQPTARTPLTDCLPKGHWARYRLNTWNRKSLLLSVGFAQTPEWFFNEYGYNW